MFAIQGKRTVSWVRMHQYHDADVNKNISNTVEIEIRGKRYAEDSLYLPLSEVESLNGPSWVL